VHIESSQQPNVSVASDLLVIGAASATDDNLSALAAKCPSLGALLEARDFKGKSGSSVAFPALGSAAARDILIVGTGDGSHADITKAAAKAGKHARSLKAEHVCLSMGNAGAEAIEALSAGNYVFDTYLPEARKGKAIGTLTLCGMRISDSDIQRAQILMAAQSHVRDLVNGPPDDIHPQSLAAAAEALGSIDHVEVDVWDIDRCKAENCVGIEAVGRGSVHPGCMIHIKYRPPGAQAHIALVGKGVTFDAGGYSIKPSSGMQTMRCDMGGAGTMLGVAKAAAELGVPVAMDTFLGAVENLIDADAYKLGDILSYPNGVTVEIHNTDAEGRLVLADCLLRACKVEGVTHVVDAATLTGACVVAVGEDFTALFTKDDDLAGSLSSACDANSEGLWRLPLHAPYNDMLKSDYAQIKNVGGRSAGATTAALFLQHFVSDDVSWAHLDVAGSAFHDKGSAGSASGATGQMVRSLVAWLEGLAS